MQTLNPIADFFTKGYVEFQMSDLKELTLFEGVSFKSVQEHDDDCDETWIPANFKKDLFIFAQSLFEKIVVPVFPSAQFLTSSVWDGVDLGSVHWHNDCHSSTSLNSNLLLYLDSPTKSEYGSLFIQGNGQDSRIQPKQGKIVWLNQTHLFQHRADQSPERRRVVGVDLYIPEIAHLTSFRQKEEPPHGSTT